ncbi:MAG: hypothetical protein AB9860_05665 [Methanomassiliicoccales archaeon]
MKLLAATAIALFIFTALLISFAPQSSLAAQPDLDTIAALSGLDLGESEDEGEGSFHVPLFAVATFFGLIAAVTGVKNSSYRWLRELVPLTIPRKLHRFSSIACWILFMVTFLLWTLTYYSDRREIFHTLHGMLALTTFTFALASILTGAGMLRNVKRWRLVHLALSNMAFLLLVLTDLSGMVLED